MHLIPLVQDLAVILCTAGLSALGFQRIKQPVVLGYLVAGIVVGPHTPPFSWVTDLDGIQTWSELGVIFLMFSLGLEFSLKRLLSIGATPLIAGPFEALVMTGLGFLTGKLMGWGTLDCIFLGSILAISSTAIIVKTLDEMGLKKKRFAELIFGVLVIEDLVGILILVGLSSLQEDKGVSGLHIIWVIAKLVLIVGVSIGAGYLLVNRFIRYIGRRSNDETLTLVSLGLCLGLVTVANRAHFSAALGAFIMGSILAGSSEVKRIEKLVQPLRDVFAAVFFVSIGMLLNPSDLLTYWKPIVWVSLVTVLGKWISTALGFKLSGQPLRVSAQAGSCMAQVGEFSFVIAALGTASGLMSPFLYPITVSVAVLTTFTTPYLIRSVGQAVRVLR